MRVTLINIATNDVFDIFVFFIENSKRFHGINKGKVLRGNSPGGYDFGAADLGTGDIAVFNNRIDRLVATFNKVAEKSSLHAIGTILATIIQMSEHEIEHLVQKEAILGKRIHPDAPQFAKELIAMIKAYDDYYISNHENIMREQDAKIVGYFRAIEVLKQFLPESVGWFQEAYKDLTDVSLRQGKIKLDFKHNHIIIPIDATSNIAATQITDIVMKKELHYL